MSSESKEPLIVAVKLLTEDKETLIKQIEELKKADIEKE